MLSFRRTRTVSIRIREGHGAARARVDGVVEALYDILELALRGMVLYVLAVESNNVEHYVLGTCLVVR